MARMTKEQKLEKQLDKQIEATYYRLASGVQVNIMDITKIFRDCRSDMNAGKPVEEAVQEAIARYRVN